jgi:hypothetical protein
MPAFCEPLPDRPDRPEIHEQMALRHSSFQASDPRTGRLRRPEASEFDRMARLLGLPEE